MSSSLGHGQRAVIIAMVVAFFISSFALSGFVIWSLIKSNNDQSSQTEQNQPKENQLQGTKLENFKPVDSVDKLKIIDIKEGKGETVKKGDTITAHYTGALAKTGVIFQSSYDNSGQPFSAVVQVATSENGGSGLIAGWVEGIPGMKPGGKRRLIIPSDLAYGQTGYPPTIGPNEPLVFDIDLVSIDK